MHAEFVLERAPREGDVEDPVTPGEADEALLTGHAADRRHGQTAGGLPEHCEDRRGRAEHRHAPAATRRDAEVTRERGARGLALNGLAECHIDQDLTPTRAALDRGRAQREGDVEDPVAPDGAGEAECLHAALALERAQREGDVEGPVTPDGAEEAFLEDHAYDRLHGQTAPRDLRSRIQE
eukprot:7618738-Heterocapsa_arctica.AAC.1